MLLTRYSHSVSLRLRPVTDLAIGNIHTLAGSFFNRHAKKDASAPLNPL